MPNGVDESVVEGTTGSNDQTQQVAETTQETTVDVEGLQKQIETLTAELEKKTSNLQAARRFEQENKAKKNELEAQLSELSTYKERAEQAENKLKTVALNGALQEAAKAAKAKNVPALLKLVDRSGLEVIDGEVDTKAVEAAIQKAREEAPELFEITEMPKTARAAEGAVTSGFEVELAAAKTREAKLAVLQRYGKA